MRIDQRWPEDEMRKCQVISDPSLKFSGGLSRGEIPVPIPNTEVKPSNADGTALVTVWESRTLPEIF